MKIFYFFLTVCIFDGNCGNGLKRHFQRIQCYTFLSKTSRALEVLFKLTNDALSYEKMGTKYIPWLSISICQLAGMPLSIWGGTENPKRKLQLVKLPGFLQIKQRTETNYQRDRPQKKIISL